MADPAPSSTALPPSPVESPSRCDSPASSRTSDPDPPRSPQSPKAPKSPVASVVSLPLEQPALAPTVPLPSDSPGLPPNLDPPLPSPAKPSSPVQEEVPVDAPPTPTPTPRMGDRKRPPVPRDPPSSPSPGVSFAQFAAQFHLKQHQEAQKRSLLQQLRSFRISVCLSSRLLRLGAISHKGLVESFKHGDKAAFISIYNSIHEVREVCEPPSSSSSSSLSSASRLGHDSLLGFSAAADLETRRPCSFVHQLTPRSREYLLEILTLVRTDPQFLFERIGNLLPSQLSALISSVHALEVSDSVFPLASGRGRTQPLFSKRTATHSTAFKEHALGFERTDPLSALIFNVFASSGNTDSREAWLRLDVWSSTCAKLVAHGGSSHYSFVGHLLSAWATSSEWKAKQKFEIYLMDVLQKGSFLLEYPETPRRLGHDGELPDPLRTSVAEEFFHSAVRGLFELLDDSDGGFPTGALELGNAILAKLGMTESRKRALEYIFFQWFFCKFLHNALSFPESHGLLLDFHISKDARERLLGQVSLRAQSHVSRVLHSLPQFSIANAEIRAHVENMVSHLCQPIPSSQTTKQTPVMTPVTDSNPSARFLLLSATDINTLLDVLFPRAPSAFHSPDLFQNPSFPSSPNSSYFSRSGPASRPFEPNLFQGRIDTSRSTTAKTLVTTKLTFQDATRSSTVPSSNPISPVSPPNSLSRNADQIRYELSEINASEDRTAVDHPSNEDWALFSVSQDGKSLALVPSLEQELSSGEPYSSDQDARPRSSPSEDDQETLQAAIVKLIHDFDPLEDFFSYDPIHSFTAQTSELSLKQKFASAMNYCQSHADFVGAHYWWDASRLLQKAYPIISAIGDDSKLLDPMFLSLKKSVESSSSVIERCESGIVDLKRVMGRLQATTKEMMAGLAKLRNKMWYMTDVKNSLRYEEARSVALALQTMASPQAVSPMPEPKPRYGSRTLGSSFLQKPEVQTINAMKAHGSQGGRSKLSDEQVDVTRRWLERSGIDNFCRGEERIHRFCYELKKSVGKLVGETMYETPVLWSSELYQKERSIYEASGPRTVTGLAGGGSSIRPSSIASEESLYPPSQTYGPRNFDHIFRPLNEAPSIVRKSSFQSLASDRWRSGRDAPYGDTSSIGDSPGRAVSTSASDSTFWSPIQTQAQSTTSASSFHSRPPSMFSDVLTSSRRPERNAHGKVEFLDELRQTLTSLLLSDLGSPVWSCGSETDAWFSDYLNQPRIQAQIERRARLERYLAELAGGDDENGPPTPRNRLQRSRSADSILQRVYKEADSPAQVPDGEVPESSGFGFDAVFRQLMERFSRQANPYTKLKALQDLRSLLISSLISENDGRGEVGVGAFKEPSYAQSEHGRPSRYSLSEGSRLQQGDERNRGLYSPMWGSVAPSSTYSMYTPSTSEIILAMRDLIQTIQPKTLFRDLQFISAFVPSETLNKSESGPAFMQFGLAAYALKDDVCNSMVEIADHIVSQELSGHQQQRHRQPSILDELNNNNLSQPKGIDDAKWMWIITAREGNPVAQRELAILYLTHPEILPRVTLPLTMPRDTFKQEMMYRRDQDSKSDPQSMCLALHWMQLSAAGGDELASNRLREREVFDSIA
ncbi:hypothetical protein FQN52_008869 [Onygenales sp. PD_12]|nr:hypothetical protein FQN52_008869 [Onygenales sp. PD_12]